MKHKFIEKKFNDPTLAMIGKINGILENYRQQNFRLSLRQLYYQLVSKNIVENTVQSYKRVGGIVSDGRQAGLIDWEMIEDRGRETTTVAHWQSPAEIIRVAARQFRIDKWENQPWHIEVMVEKDALSGVLEPVCRRLDIAITANKGYSSSSTMYEIGQRLHNRFARDDKQIMVIYLGDHDPSGIDMTRDVADRLAMYSEIDADEIEVARVALNYNQIELWQPPENPAKQTDSRFAAYEAKFGQSSWELDAVESAQLATLIEDLVLDKRDPDLWDESVEKEEKMIADLLTFSKTYKPS